MNKKYTREIKEVHSSKKDEICLRLVDFKKVYKSGDDEKIFAELAFCLLTPQSKAKTCWKAVQGLLKKKLLLKGSRSQVLKEVKDVRFKNKKSGYICGARRVFSNSNGCSVKSKLKESRDAFKIRDWLVENIKGIGYKEASHFLRNIGFGEDLTILDRHILKNLKLLGVIDEVPGSMTKKRYLDIEQKMVKFAHNADIPVGHLDLVLWCKETGEVFK